MVNPPRKVKPTSPDSRTIDLDDEYSMHFWANELNVSISKLTRAVDVAGNAVIDVKRQLNKPKV